MTTAKEFGFCLKNAGKNAKFSKFDIKEAYKLIPAKPWDYKSQGFEWLGKYYVETQQTFGGVPSVCNFDRLGNTVEKLVTVLSGTPRKWVSRTLDDFQVVGPEDSGITENFSRKMVEVCSFVNIPLAEECEKCEKAFKNKNRGTVLGIEFDSTEMKWYLSKEKSEKIMNRCVQFCGSMHVDLNQTQKVMGSVNDLGQMCPFLKFYKGSGNNLLSRFGTNENILLPVPVQVKEDLMVAARVALTAQYGIPIADRKSMSPLSTLDFRSDAAGAKYVKYNGSYVQVHESMRGVSCIGGTDENSVWIWTRLSWPEKFLESID